MLVTRENFTNVIEEFLTPGYYAFDTETTGLHPHLGDRLFSLILANGSNSYYLNFQTYPDLHQSWVLPKAWLKEHIEKIFQVEKSTWFAHNAKFDMAMLWYEGIEITSQVHCTEVVARLLKNNEFDYSLGACSKRLGLSKSNAVDEYIKQHNLFTVTQKPGKKEKDKKPHFDKVPFNIISQYGEQDGKITYALGMHQIAEITKINADTPTGKSYQTFSELYEREKKLTKVCFAMELAGIKIDKEFCEKAYKYEIGKANNAAADFTSAAGIEFMDSRVVLAKAFDAAKEKYPTTEKGNPSFTDEVLEGFTSPLAKCVQTYRKASKLANTYFRNFIDLSDTNGRIHANMRQGGTETGRFSYSEPNCLSMDTEILTAQGWKNCAAVTKKTQIACYNKETNLLEFHNYQGKFIGKNISRKMIHIHKKNYDMLLTPDHTVLYKNRRNGKLDTVSADCFRKDAHILQGAQYLNGNFCPDKRMLKLAVAIQADGHFTKGNQIVFGFRKKRKVIQICELLKSLNIEFRYTITDIDRHTITISKPDLSELLDENKCFTNTLLALTPELRLVFLHELSYWDGLSTRLANIEYYSKNKINVDIVQALAVMQGYRTKVSYYTNNSGGSCYKLYITKRQYTGTANTKIKEITKKCRIWCVKVPTGFIVARRNGMVFITGNCQNVPKDVDPNDLFPVRRAFIPTNDDYCLVMIDYKTMEYIVMVDYAQQMNLIYKIQEGIDVHQATADMLNISRGEAKTLNFMLLYGGGIEKLMRMLSLVKNKAIELRNTYFLALPKVKDLSTAIRNKADNDSKVINLGGFICRYDVDQKSKEIRNAITFPAPNHFIQGGCAQIVRMAMIKCFDILKGTKSRLLLQVHDELVFEIHKSELDIVLPLKLAMESAFKLRWLELQCDVSHSWKSWADKVKGFPTIETRNQI